MHKRKHHTTANIAIISLTRYLTSLEGGMVSDLSAGCCSDSTLSNATGFSARFLSSHTILCSFTLSWTNAKPRISVTKYGIRTQKENQKHNHNATAVNCWQNIILTISFWIFSPAILDKLLLGFLVPIYSLVPVSRVNSRLNNWPRNV